MPFTYVDSRKVIQWYIKGDAKKGYLDGRLVFERVLPYKVKDHLLVHHRLHYNCWMVVDYRNGKLSTSWNGPNSARWYVYSINGVGYNDPIPQGAKTFNVPSIIIPGIDQYKTIQAVMSVSDGAVAFRILQVATRENNYVAVYNTDFSNGSGDRTIMLHVDIDCI